MTLPEVEALDRGGARVRIPPLMDVPLTERVGRLIDTAPMRRLASVSQLGLVAMVYPGATHSRLEHSLGVYANSLRLLDRLAHGWDAFGTPVNSCATQEWRADDNEVSQEAFMVAALTHDAGHWPFCHPIEDMGTFASSGTSAASMPLKHEQRVEALLTSGELAACLAEDWKCTADDVMAILCPKTWADRSEHGQCQLTEAVCHFYATCLSGPIDIDKLDYLQRDSHHAGVPYGRNFDFLRIVAGLQPHPTSPKLAIGEKGRTAAEMLVFGRYVMFSEVYWHHAVRSATAMLQRALFELMHQTSDTPSLQLAEMADLPDNAWITTLRESASESGLPSVTELVEGLFGPRRRLFKRISEFNIESGNEMHRRLARRPYWWLVECAHSLAARISDATDTELHPALVLIDAPPVKLEVDINMDVIASGNRVMTLGDVSPVVSALANQQFDNHVKRIRIFVPDRVRKELRSKGMADQDTLFGWLADAIAATESEVA